IRPEDQRGLLVALRLDGVLVVVHREEALAYVGIGDLVAGGDDVLGRAAQNLQDVVRTALDGGRQRGGSILRRGERLLRLGGRAQQEQRGDARQDRALQRLQTDHGVTSAGIFAPPASQSL